MMRPSDSLSAALKKVGITSGSAMLAEYGLAASAQIVSEAFNGDQDAIAQAMGRMEAMKAVVSLTGGTYKDFASEFGSTMAGITASARAVQTQSYESKLARLKAATDSFKIKTGQDINTIKGFFVDIGAAFMSHVANPIMSTPVGGVFRGLSAVVGLGAQSLLSLGGGVLNSAAQFSVLAANVKNFGGYSQMLKGTLSVLGVPIKTLGSGIARLGGSMVAHIGAMITQIATTFTATAATSGYAAAMWAAVGATWAAVWPVLAVIAAIALVAGGVYLIIKNWSVIWGFFKGLWAGIQDGFAKFIDWITPAINVLLDIIVAPFKLVGNIIGKIKGLFGEATGESNAAVTELSQDIDTELNQNVTRTITSGTELADATSPALETATPTVTGTALSIPEAASQTFSSFATPSRASAPDLTYTASSAFSDALSGTVTPDIDMSALERQVEMSLQQVVLPQAPTLAPPAPQSATRQRQSFGVPKITIEKLYVQAEDIKDAVDFYNILTNMVHQPEEAPV
jgi:hypothetical protein